MAKQNIQIYKISDLQQVEQRHRLKPFLLQDFSSIQLKEHLSQRNTSGNR